MYFVEISEILLLFSEKKKVMERQLMSESFAVIWLLNVKSHSAVNWCELGAGFRPAGQPNGFAVFAHPTGTLDFFQPVSVTSTVVSSYDTVFQQ